MRLEDELHHKVFEDAFMQAILNVMVTSDKIGRATNVVLKPFGISKEQFNVLRILRGQYPNPATVHSIQERMISKSSNATRLVEKMRVKGLVARTPCEKDRRKVDVMVTEAGLDLLKQVDPVVRESSERFRRISAAEARELNRILDKMRA